MKCHSFFQESSSSQCTTSELPDHLLTSILSSSSGTTTSTSPPSSADPRSCPSSVANLSTTLLYSTNDVIVVANKHLHLDTPTLEDGTIHAICSTNSSQDSSLSASTSTLHNQVFYSEDNKPSSSQYQYLSQSQSQSNHGPEKYPQDLPPHTQFSQEALFRSQTDDETQIKSNQETTLLHTTPPAPSPATFCVLFSAQLDPTSSPLTQAQGHQNNSINNDINNNIATISQDNISLLCVQEHQQPQREGSNWFLNNTFNSFSFEPVASCLLSLWSITELSSSGEDWNTCNTKSKNSLSHMSRKRNFADAVEMASPLRNSPSVHHPSWIGSVKRRKIHQFATKWTSGLAPSSFVKIYTMLDFWQVMATRMDCSWLNFDTISEGSTNDMDASETCDMAMESTPPPSPMSERPRSIYMEDDTQNTHTIGETMPCRSGRATLQFPHPGQILRGLWEEEQQNKRRQQMVPDNVRRQARSKTFKTPLDARTRAQLEPWRLTSTNQGRIKPMFCSSSPDGQSGAADVEMAQGECFQLDDELARNKLGSITTAVQRCKYRSWSRSYYVIQRFSL